MSWLPYVFAILPVGLWAWLCLGRLPVASGPRRAEPSAERILIALVCASLGSILLASDAQSVVGLLPCESLPHPPPCGQMHNRPSLLSLSTALALGLWIVAGFALLVGRPTPQVRGTDRS